MPEPSQTVEILIKLRDEISNALKKLENEFGKVDSRVSKSTKSIQIFRKSLNGLYSGIFSLKGAFAALGIGLLARSFVDAADSAEQFRVRLISITGSADTANKLFQDMAQYASTVSFEYRDIMGAATNLAAVMKGGSEEVKKYMPIIADLAAVTGLSIEETTGQVIRMYSAGAASADMFRERGVLAMLGFQAGVSVSAEETRKRLIEAWEAPTSKFRNASVLLSHTWSGLLSMLADAWFQFRDSVMESGVFDYLKGILDTILSGIRRLKQQGRFEDFKKSISDNIIKGIEIAIKGAALLADAWRGWKMIWYGLKMAFAQFIEFVESGILKALKAVTKFITWEGKQIEQFGKFVGSDTLKNVGKWVQNIQLGTKELERHVGYWKEVRKDSEKQLAALASQQSYYSKSTKLIKEIRDRAKKAAEVFDKVKTRQTGLAPEVQPGALALAKSELARFNALTETAFAQLKNQYKEGKIGLEKYFDERESLMNKAHKKEIALLQKQAEVETNLDKKLAIQDKIFALEQKHQRDLLSLHIERNKEEERLDKERLDAEKILQEQKVRLAELLVQPEDVVKMQMQKELAALDLKHNEEIQRLKELHATKNQLEDLYRQQQLEKDAMLAKQREEINKMQLNAAIETFGSMSQALGDAYEAGGKKVKTFFYLQKAAAVAETIMSTYKAAQAAYTAMVGIPIVGPALATAAAAAAIVSGMARVTMIQSQTLAEGGPVLGHSPSPKADNIPIMATANEYVQPVSAVKYYGVDVMEAIRKKAIPKGALRALIQAVSIPQPIARPKFAFAEGGMVASAPRAMSDKSAEITIVNVPDPSMMDQYLSSAQGQNALLNVISAKAPTIKRMLA